MDDTKIDSGLGELRDRVGNLEKGLAENTAATKRIESDTTEMLDMFRLSKEGFRVLGHIGSIIKWAAAVGASVAALYFTLKGGR